MPKLNEKANKDLMWDDLREGVEFTDTIVIVIYQNVMYT